MYKSMSRKILAYFDSENDAESAKATLQTLKVRHVIVDKLPDTDEKVSYIPFTPTGQSQGAIGTIGLKNHNSEENEGQVTHLLEAQVEEEDFEKAMQYLMDNNGYEIEG